MVKLINDPIVLKNGSEICKAGPEDKILKKNTIAWSILNSHNTVQDNDNLKIRFDALASHDITYVGILQTARAAGLKEIDIPYVLTNCHNSLCAVGGTINEDDHRFGLSAAEKYGAIYVPPHLAVIHAFMREMMSGCGKMILGSDSHTRYGALGTLAIGEGGPELVKQIMNRTYDISMPDIIAVRLTGKPEIGVGPQDVALSIIGSVFPDGFVKNKILEFVGDGISSLPIEFRNGIDVMTTETSCLSSIWVTDNKTKKYYENQGRTREFKVLKPGEEAYYDGAVDIDLSTIEPMIAMPFHPSNVFTVKELNHDASDILNDVEKRAEEQLGLKKGSMDLVGKVDKATGRVKVDQGIIAGCAGGTFDNICAASDILSGKSTGNGGFSLSVYPQSMPVFANLADIGVISSLMRSGAVVKTAFCGPCFGAGDTPANASLSIRHTTRNFPNREGSKPNDNQIASVALMDARSIAATAASGGLLTSATEINTKYKNYKYRFDKTIYDKRVYFGFGKPDTEKPLIFGPNITDWPEQSSLKDNIMLGIASVIDDDVTTTDELIPSGETSSYRSNPKRLSRFALSRRDPGYVGRADRINDVSTGNDKSSDEYYVYDKAVKSFETYIGSKIDLSATNIASSVVAVKPGDGSAREQAASCQRVLGGAANISREYATKRYRSNLINWGMLPLTNSDLTIGKNPGTSDNKIENGDWVFIPEIKKHVINDTENIAGFVFHSSTGKVSKNVFALGKLTPEEKEIILAGCLTNKYRNESKKEK